MALRGAALTDLGEFLRCLIRVQNAHLVGERITDDQPQSHSR